MSERYNGSFEIPSSEPARAQEQADEVSIGEVRQRLNGLTGQQKKSSPEQRPFIAMGGIGAKIARADFDAGERQEIFKLLAQKPEAAVMTGNELKTIQPGKGLSEKDIAGMESSQALVEGIFLAMDLKGMEYQINHLAEKGEKRTKEQEKALNRLMVWYIIYRKLYAEANMRHAVAFEKFLNAPRTAGEQRQAFLKNTLTPPALIKAEVKPHSPKIRYSPVIKTSR